MFGIEIAQLEWKMGRGVVAEIVKDARCLMTVVPDQWIGTRDRRKEHDEPGRAVLQTFKIGDELHRLFAKGSGIEERWMKMTKRVAVDPFGEDAEAPGGRGVEVGIRIELLVCIAAGVVRLPVEMEDSAQMLFDRGEGLVISKLKDEHVCGMLP